MEHLRKFGTNGEEIYKVRHLILQHFDDLVAQEEEHFSG